jgi:large subunit ribosomal protein L10
MRVFTMSKVIKQMEMDALKKSFSGVRDMVVLSIKGLGSLGDHTLRSNLRKKKIRLQVVKNSLTRRVFSELGLAIKPESPYWTGPTAVAWGANSVAELSRGIEGELRAPKTAPLFKDKVKIKGAVADGEEVPFDVALKMPTREEAIGAILAMILSPGAAIAGCLTGPGGAVASQVQTISEKKEGEAAPAS